MEPDQTQHRIIRKGSWMREEDVLLRKCIEKYGEGNWNQVPLRTGLNRCRKSCRLRWLNYLQPNIKRGDFAMDEVDLIIRMHKLLGNKWSLIAGRLPGRTANDVKNYWNVHLKKKHHHHHRTEQEQPSSSKMVTDHERLPEFLTDEALMTRWREKINDLFDDDYGMKKLRKGVMDEEAEKVNSSGSCCWTTTTKTTSSTRDNKDQQDLCVDDYLLVQQKCDIENKLNINILGDEGQSYDFDQFVFGANVDF